MGGFLILLSLAVAVLSLIGVVRGRILFVQGRGRAALGLVLAFILFVVGGAALPASAPKDSAPASGSTEPAAPTETPRPEAKAPASQPQPAAPAPSGPSIETQRADFKAWYDKVMNIQNRADKAMGEYQKIADDLAKGSATLVDAYAATKSLRDVQAAAQSAMYGLKAPTSLSGADQQKLNKATQDLATGIFSRRTALDKVLRYLDEQKPSLIANAQDDLKMANSFMIQGIVPIVEVQTALGIELTATP